MFPRSYFSPSYFTPGYFGPIIDTVIAVKKTMYAVGGYAQEYTEKVIRKTIEEINNEVLVVWYAMRK